MKPQNLSELRDRMLDIFDGLADGTITVPQAMTATKITSVVIDSLKVQIDLSRMLDVKPNIPFLGDVSGGKMIEHQNDLLEKKE